MLSPVQHQCGRYRSATDRVATIGRVRQSISHVDVLQAVAAGAWAGLLAAHVVTGAPWHLAYVIEWAALAVVIATARTRWRRLGLAAWGIAFLASAVESGLPLNDRDRLLFWLIGTVALLTIGRDAPGIARMIRDWAPFVVLLLLYDYSRSLATHVGMPLQVRPQIDADRLLGFGHVPTVWLQRHLLAPHHVAWWEGAVLLVYLSHFVVTYVAAAYLWTRDRDAWWRYTVRFMTLSFMGVATYVLLPAVPPWLAAQKGALGVHTAISRSVVRGFDVLHLNLAKPMFAEGQAGTNLVAALPSLHAAFAALFAAFFWTRVRHPVLKGLLAAYAVAMAFTLVLSGEHYVVDVLLGWAYVGAVMAVFGAFERGGVRRETLRATATEAVPASATIARAMSRDHHADH